MLYCGRPVDVVAQEDNDIVRGYFGFQLTEQIVEGLDVPVDISDSDRRHFAAVRSYVKSRLTGHETRVTMR